MSEDTDEVKYKHIKVNSDIGRGLTKELNVTGYAREHSFPLKYQKTITKLKKRSPEVDEAIQALRSHERNGTTTGLIIEYLLEGCIINVFGIVYKRNDFMSCREFEDFVDLHGDQLARLIFDMMDGDFCYDDEEIIIYAYHKTIEHIKGFIEDISDAAVIIRDPHIPIIIKYLKEELIPQLNITEVSFEPAYLTEIENYALRSGPDFVINGNIIELKVCSKCTWIYWARQLYLYRKGFIANGNECDGCFILNLYTNEIIEFTFREDED